MPFSATSRAALTAALVHLIVAAALLLLAPDFGSLGVRWDVVVWLLLVGFVGTATTGFALHLFPTVSRRSMPPGTVDRLAFLLTEGAVVVGAVSLAVFGGAVPDLGLAAASGLYVAAAGIILARFARALSQVPLDPPGRAVRPGDRATVPLFVASWTSAVGAGSLFLFSSLAPGPGFGWWIAGVHLFVLGHVTLLVTAVSLRLVPRSLEADPSVLGVAVLAGLAGAGAVAVPVGMLATNPPSAAALDLAAAPEAVFAAAFLTQLGSLGIRAKTPRRPLALHVAALVFLLGGGGVGLDMVARSNYGPVVAHALVNVLGFVGLTILFMWFGLVAPFQRISHAWTRRMLWGLSVGWVGAVVALGVAGAPSLAAPAVLGPVGGGLLLGVALAWAAGTVPVMYPRLNPLPGLSSAKIGEIRERRKGR